MNFSFVRILVFGTLIAGIVSPVFIPARGCAVEGGVEGAAPSQVVSPSVNRPHLQGPLTLERCIEIALANNPDISADTFSAAAAGARYNAARAARWPNITGDGFYQRYNDPQRLIQARYNGELGYFDRDLFVGGMTFRMPIFTGGRITSDIDAAELIRLSAGHKLTRTRDEVIFNVSSVYYTVLSQREVIKSLYSNEKALTENKKVIGALFSLKKAAKVDLLRIDVRLASLQQSIIKEKNTLNTQRRILANLMGVEASIDDLPEDRPLIGESMPNLEDLIAKAMSRRPDFMSLKSEVEAQGERVSAAAALRWPNISALAQYGSRANAEGNEHVVFSGGFGVSVSLFDGGLISAKVAEERAKQSVLKEKLRKLELQIRAEVETSLSGYESDLKRTEVNEKAVEQAKESLRIEIQKYELGMGSATNVLDAQAALVQAETDYYRSLASCRIDKAKLILDTGGAL